MEIDMSKALPWIITSLLFCGSALAEGVGDATGESGAKAGTVFFNALHPDKPLPLSNGDVLSKTAQNLGAGQSVKNAWSNAAADAAGVKPSPTPTPSPSPSNSHVKTNVLK
jgi:hypothetical protein